MTKYERGRKLERQLVDFMEFHGFHAIRSAGSKGIFDVMAIPKTNLDISSPIVFQCKKDKAKNTKELQNLIKIGPYINAHVVWVTKNPGSTKAPKFKIVSSNETYEPHEFLTAFYGNIAPLSWFLAIKAQQDINRLLRKGPRI